VDSKMKGLLGELYGPRPISSDKGRYDGSLAVGLTAESKSFEKTSRGGIIRIIIDGWLKEIFTKSSPSFASSGSATAGIESICYDVTVRTSEPPLGLHLSSVCVCKFGNLLVIKVVGLWLCISVIVHL
jgi:hypothetical protein